jgi:hypothetical protein
MRQNIGTGSILLKDSEYRRRDIIGEFRICYAANTFPVGKDFLPVLFNRRLRLGKGELEKNAHTFRLPTKPRPGLRDLRKSFEGNRPIIGTSESSSLHSTFRAGSENALHVRANRERDRLPPGDSKMASSNLFVALGSLRIPGTMVLRWTS